MVMRTPPHKGILWINTNNRKDHRQGSNRLILWQSSNCDWVPVAVKLMLSLFTPPARGEEVESDGAADDLLHVWADERQLHHHPQDDTRHLSESGSVYKGLSWHRIQFATHPACEETFYCWRFLLCGTTTASYSVWEFSCLISLSITCKALNSMIGAVFTGLLLN